MKRPLVILSAVTALAVCGAAAAPASAGTIMLNGGKLECTNTSITFDGQTFTAAQYTYTVTLRTGGGTLTLPPFTVWHETCRF